MKEKELNPQSVEFAVRETAKSGKPYNCNELSADRAAAHVEACKQVVAWSEKNPDIPFYLCLVFIVAQGAPKTDEYKAGYAKRVKGTDIIVPKTDCSRATLVAKWYRSYHKAGIGGGSRDVAARVLLKFHAAQKNPETGNVNAITANAVFYKALKAAEELGKYNGEGHGDFKNMCENLGINPAKKTKKIETEAA